MKRCEKCTSAYASGNWTCPACGFAPKQMEGFTQLAPELALNGSGFQPEAQAELATLRGGQLLVAREESINYLGYAAPIPYEDEFYVGGAFDVLEHIDQDEMVLNEMKKRSAQRVDSSSQPHNTRSCGVCKTTARAMFEDIRWANCAKK